MVNKNISVRLVLCVFVLKLGVFSSIADGVEIEGKLDKYHEILLKRPESANLFEKFQSQFLAEFSEKELDAFLKGEATGGKVSDMQVYASYLLQRGKENEALETLTGALKLEENRQVYLDRGRVHARGLAFDVALLDLDKALGLGEGDARFELEVNKLIGRYLIRQGSADEAIAHWQKLADANPDDQELIEDLIDILSGDGLYKPALAHAENLRDSTRDPYKKALRTLRVGDLLQKMGERDKAVVVYHDTLKLSGVGSWLEREILAQIETLHRREDNLVGFKDKLQVLTGEFPQRLQISQKLADIYSDIGSHKEARELYLSMMKRSPNDPALKSSLLQALDKAQDHKASRSLVESMMKLSPRDSELSVKLAEICYKLKDRKGVLEHLSGFRANSDVNVANGLRYVSLLRKFEFSDEALKGYEELVGLYPEADDVVFVAADFYVVSGKKDEALKLWDSLSGSGKLETVNRLLETLMFQNEKEKALAVVVAEMEGFKIKSNFVSLAMTVALANKDVALSKELAGISLKLAKSPIEIDNAIRLLAKTLTQFDLVEGELLGLEKKDKLTVKETFLKAQLLHINGNEGDANGLIVEMSKTTDLAALLQVVRLYEQRYELDQAAEVLGRLIELPNGLKPSYLKQLCLLYKRSGMITEALKVADRWKKLSPSDKQAWLTHVELMEIEEGAEAALQQLRRGLERFEGEQDIYVKLASLYAASEKNTQAGQLYWRLYDEAKDITERTQWASQLAQLAERDNTTDELVDIFVERRRNAPESIAPIMALSEVYRVIGREEERRNLMLEAARLRPDDATIFIEIANSDLKSGKRTEAIAALHKAQKVDKSDTASRKLAKLYIEDDNYDQGLQELEKVNNGKDGARSTETIVISLIRQDAYEEAGEFLNKKMIEYANDGRLVLLSALIKYELGYANESYRAVQRIFSDEVTMDGVKDGWVVVEDPKRTAMMKSQGAYRAKRVLSSLTQSKSNQYYRYNSYRGGGNQQLMPKDMNSLKLMATLLFCQILNDVDLQTQEEWQADQEARGMKYLSFYRAISSSQREGETKEIMALCMKNLDDPFYLSLAFSLTTQRGEYILPKEVLAKLKEHKEKLPKNVQDMIPYCVVTGANKEEYLEYVLKQFESRVDLTHEDMMLLLNLFSREVYSSPEANVPEGAMKLFSGYLEKNPVDVKFKFTNQVNPPNDDEMKMRVSYGVASTLEVAILKGEDYKKIAALMNDPDSFIARSYSLQGRSILGGYGYGNNRVSLKNVDGLFSSINGLQQQILSKEHSYIGKIDFTKLYKEIESFENPLLRYKIAMRAEPEKDHSALLEVEIPSKYLADIQLQKASAYFIEGDKLSAVKLLEGVRKTTNDRGLRKQLDFLTIECATNLEDKKIFTGWEAGLQKDIKSTARRLLLGRKITNSDEIKLIIGKLDMESESARYLTKSNQSVRKKKLSGGVLGLNLSSSGHSSSSSSSNNYPWDKAAEQLKKNQQEGAVRTSANALKSYFRSSNQDYYVRQMVTFIQKEKLGAKVIERLSPKDSVSPRKWLVYYKAAKVLGLVKDTEKSIEFLKNLSLVPSSVKLPLALALIEEDTDRAIKMLKQYPDQNQILKELGQFMINRQRQVYDYKNRKLKDGKIIEGYIAMFKSCNRYLESLDQKDFFSSNFGNFYNNFARRSSMLKSYFEGIGDDKLAVYEAQIAEVKKPLHSYALINPQSADIAFQALHGYYTQIKKLDELETELLDSLSMMKEGRADHQHGFSNYGGYVNYGYGESTEAVSRSSYLASLMLEKKNPKLVSDEVIKSLEILDAGFAGKLKFHKKHLFLESSKLKIELAKLSKSKSAGDYLNWAEFIKLQPSTKVIEQYSSILIESFSKDQIIKASGMDHEFEKDLEHLSSSLMSFISENPSLRMEENLNKLLKALADSVVGGATTDSAKLEAWLDSSASGYTGQNESSNAVLFNSLLKKLTRTPVGVKILTKACRESNYPHFMDSLSQKNTYSSRDQLYIESADEWVKLLRNAKFIASIEEYRISQLNSFSKSDLKQYSGKYTNLSYQLNNYDPNNSASTDIEIICKTIRFYSSGEDASNTKKEILEKLKAIKGKEELSAQLLVLLIEDRMEYNLPLFCRKYSKQISNSPASFKQSLVSIFDLNHNRKNLSYFKSAKLDGVLPLDEELLNKGGGEDLKRFLALKSPLHSQDLDDLDETVVDLIHGSIYKDVAVSKKVLNHFIDLVKNSPDAGTAYYTNRTLVSPLQSAWIGSVMEELAERGVYPKYTLPLIYSVYQRKDSSILNITLGIEKSFDRSWPINKVFGPTQQSSVTKIFKDFASFYATVKSEEERRFYRVAWFSHMNRQYIDGYLNYSPFHQVEHVSKLKKKNEIENEFYDWLMAISSFESWTVKQTVSENEEYNYHEVKHYVRVKRLRDRYDAFYKSVENYPLKLKMLIANATLKNGVFVRPGMLSDELSLFCADTFIEVVETIPEYRMSEDIRLISLLVNSFDNLDEEKKKRFSQAAVKCLEAITEYFIKGGSLHKNYVENMVVATKHDEAAVKAVAELVDKYPDAFKGLISFAHILVQFGYVDQAFNILDPSIIMKISSDVHYRTSYTEGLEKNLPALLAKYTDPSEKATVAAVFLLMDNEVDIENKNISYIERVSRVIDLARLAEPDFPLNSEMKFVKSGVKLYFTPEQAVKSAEFFKDLIASNNAEVLGAAMKSKTSSNYTNIYAIRAATRYALGQGDTSYIGGHIKYANELSDNLDDLSREEARYISYVLKAGIGTINDMWADGRYDEQVKNLLPIYRELMLLKSKCGYYHKKNGFHLAPKSNFAAEFIHDDLGQSKEWDELVAKNELNFEFHDVRYLSPLCVLYGTGINTIQITRNVPSDSKKFLLRLINNKRFQKHVVSVQERGGLFDYIVDMGLLSIEHAMEFIESGKIEIHEPALKGVIESDLMHFAVLEGRYDDIPKHAAAMQAVFAEHPTPKTNTMLRLQMRAARYLIDTGKKDLAKGMVLLELLPDIDVDTKRGYDAIRKRLDLPAIKLQGKNKPKPKKKKRKKVPAK